MTDSTASSPGAAYRAQPPGACIRRAMGIMTLVYHRRSGITHMLADPAPQILDALDALGEADAGTVAALLAERFALAAEGDVATIVAARLAELARLGLVGRGGA